jgi:hypothetical protein
MIDRFILFSLARSGSTTLLHLLNCHRDIRCINEPFNPSNFGGRYFRQVSDIVSLNDALDEIWRSFNGIKHVWHASGWPFTHRPQFNQHLLLGSRARVLLLNRRNILRRVVSSQISEQTKVWSFADESEREQVHSFEFRPLDVEWLKWQLEFEMEAIAAQKRLLDSGGVSYIELWYEDMYETATDWRRQVDKVNEIIAFVGGCAVTDKDAVAKMRDLLNPRNTKLNTHSTYRRIPGIEEIEEQFGSDETGWLFQEHGARLGGS